MRKSFSKKVIGIILTVIMSASVMVGCGPKNNNTETPSAGTDGADVAEMINLEFWRAGTDVDGETYWKDCIARFEADNPNIKINLSSLPWGDDIETKLNAAYASDTAPDVLNYAIVSIPQRAGVGQYLALDDYIADWEGKDDIYESILDSGKYQDKVYGLGMKPDPRMFVWRKDMFEEAGLDPDTPPNSWEELKEYAIKLTKKDGKTTTQSGFNFAIANGFQDFQIFLTQNGGEFIDASNNEVMFDSPEAIETLEYLTEFAKEGLTIPADTFQTGTDAFANGVSAMTYKNPSDIRVMLEANPELKGKIGMRAPLSKEQSKTFSGLALQFISESSRNKDALGNLLK